MSEAREKKEKTGRTGQGQPGRQDAAKDFDELLRLTYENSPLGMGFISLDGVLMDCNDALATVIGSPREALIGSPMRAGIIDEGIAVAIAKAFSGTIGVFEGDYAAAGKGTITLRTIHAPLYNQDGEMKGVLFVAEDISERKRMEDRLRESERRYKAIVDSQAEFVVRYLPGGILTFVNDTLSRYLKMQPDDLLGRSYYPFMHPDDRAAFIGKIEALDRDHPSMVAEARVVLPDGKVVWHRWSHHAIFDDQGRPAEYQSTGRDVTEIREAEDLLRESEEKFSKIFKQAPLLITLSEVESGRFLDVNEKFLEISGFARAEVIGRTVVDLGWISEDDRELLLQAIREEGRVSGMELTLRRRDGGSVVCLYNGELITVNGRQHLLSIAQDITERKRSESALKQSEEKYRHLYNETPILLHSMDRDARLVDVNDYWLKTLGYTRSEVIGRKVTDFFTEASRKYAQEVVQPAFFRDGIVTDISYQFVKKNGELIDVVLSATAERDAAGNVVRSRAVITDVTERKRTEDLLRKSDARYRLLYEGTPVMMHSIDAEGRLISVSDQWLTTLGYTRDEVLGRRSTDFLDEQSSAYARNEVLPDFMRTGICADVPYTFVKKNGERISTLLSAIAERDESGKVVRSLAVILDITERRKAESRMQESEKKYRNLFESATDGVFIADLGGSIIDANTVAYQRLGYTKEELLAMTVNQLDSPEFAARVPERFRQIREQTMALFESGHKRKDGSVMPVEVNARLIDYEGRPVILSLVRDITERKRAEEALKKSEKMLQTIIEAEPECVKVLDENACLIMMNRAGLDMLQVDSLDQVKGQCVCPMVTSEYQPAFLDLTKRVFHGESGNLVFEMVGVKGRHLWLETHAVPLRNEKDEIVAVLGLTRDITERKRAEEELQEKENRYRTLFEAANDGIFIQDATGFRDCNRRGAEMYGLTRKEVIGRHPGEFAPERQPDGRLSSEFAAEKTQAALNGVPQVFEWQPLRADGTPFDVEVTLSRLELGGEVCLQAIVRDITERKRVGKALQESEERYRTIFEGAAEGVALADVATRKLLYVNPAFCEMYGYTKDEAARLGVEDLHPRPAVPRAVVEFEAQARGEKILASDLPCLRKDGSVFYADVKTTKIGLGGRPAVVGFFTDITERKRAEERSRKYSRDLQRLLLVSREMTATTDIAGLYRAAVQTAVDLLGFDFSTIMVLSEDQAGLTVMDTLGFPQSMIGAYSLVDGQGLSMYVVKNRRPDAVADFQAETRFEVPAIVRQLGIRSALCVPMMLGERVFGVLIGHTLEQREFSPEETAIYENIGNEAAIAIRNAINLNELAKGEAKLRNIASNIAEGLYVLDEAGRVTFMNEEAKRLLGWSVEELNERGAHQLIHFRKADGTALALDDCPMHGIIAKKARFSSNDEVFVRKDGTVFPISVVCSPIVEEGGTVASVVAFRDITETKRLEQELLKIQKLESVGTLAGGIAHDFNNLLQGVFGYISMAKLSLGQKERAAALLEQAEKALHQSVNLTTQLLTFSKGGKPVKKRIRLAPVIENGVRFALSGSQLTYRIDLAQDLLPVEADEGQLGQVVHNIVLNADQAMPLGGRIEIHARNVAASSPELPPGLARTDHVRISIEDHGAGIPGEYLPRIFDPYFTTKEKGSGLGLATSYAIVRNHGGMITVSSELGKGSTFDVFLPASAPASEAQPPGKASTGSRRVKVLVMDDEEVVRNVAVELLHELGHEVECAEHGAAAVDAYRKAKDAGQPFDIVILDLTIRGGMGGMETLRRLRELDPQVKAVVSSGYSDDEAVSDFRKHGFSAFLKKPYDMSALRDMLQGLTT